VKETEPIEDISYPVSRPATSGGQLLWAHVGADPSFYGIVLVFADHQREVLRGLQHAAI
jgi:hypothetical protein